MSVWWPKWEGFGHIGALATSDTAFRQVHFIMTCTMLKYTQGKSMSFGTSPIWGHLKSLDNLSEP